MDFRGKRRRIRWGMALEWVASLRDAKNSLRLSLTALSFWKLEEAERKKEEGRSGGENALEWVSGSLTAGSL